MSAAAQITESSEAFAAFAITAWIFREGCKKHWFRFSVTFGISNPDQRLTKAEKAAALPADASPARESAFDAALKRAS